MLPRVATGPDDSLRMAPIGTQGKGERALRIYVGNLPYQISEEDLQGAFGAYGKVESVTIIRDRDTGRSKGFGFVEMPSSTEAQAAITGLNGTEMQQRALTVNEARPREERSFGGGGGFGGGRGGDRGGRGGGGGRGGSGGGSRGGPRW